ncbi:MAG TPA: alpha/beta hydrolase-fold protein, partial [Candidatus Polarisedimenticolia bacterium]|nr:alpha/beta hydrolase-fold protein [Candidatus Polarisedimenticolia bacterium]
MSIRSARNIEVRGSGIFPKAVALAWIFWILPASLIAQTQSQGTFAPIEKGLVVSDVERTEFHSKFTGEDYSVYVWLPPGYSQGDKRYPVLYVTDAEYPFLELRDASFVMTLFSHSVLQEFILVGVPFKFKSISDWGRDRSFDLTPTEDREWSATFSKQVGGTVRTGGAALFLRTLKEELIPFIESKYRVTSDRGLAGYSFGGLFAAYVWLNDGNTFSRYLISSPSLWWDKETILKTAAAVVESGKSLKGRVFLSVGADEDEDMVGPLRTLTTILRSRPYPDLHLESDIFDGEVHLSGLPVAFNRGLRFLYPPPPPKQ